MEETNEKTVKVTLEQELENSTKRERKRAAEGEAEPGVVRVRLPAALGVKAREIVATLRERGAQVSLDDLLAGYLESVPESYFEEQLTCRTPEQYYLEAAARVPELRELLIRHAKRGLLRGAKHGASAAASKPMGRRRKEANNPANESVPTMAGV